MVIQADFPDLTELKRLADACPPPGAIHFESDEFKAVTAFTDEVIRLFKSDVGMAKALIAEIGRLAPFEIVATTFLEKTEWVQVTVQPHELGEHRADILRARIAALEVK